MRCGAILSLRPVLSNSFAWEIASRKLFYFFGSAFLLRTRVFARTRALNSSKKSHIRTFSGVSARRCSAGLSSCAMIPATELFGSTRRSVLCSLFSRRASSWCALGLWGRRVCIFLSPGPVCHPREHAKLQGSCVVMPTKGVPKNSFIRLEGV